MQLIGFDVGSGGVDELVLDENGDDAAEDDEGAADFDGGVLSALEGRMCFGQARRLDDLLRHGGEAGKLYFTHVRWEVGGAYVHFFGNVLGDDIDNEFAGTSDVAGCILGDELLPWTICYADADDGRVCAEVVIGAKGSRIELPKLIHCGDKGNGPRSDQSDQQFIGLTAWRLFEIKNHRLEYS